MRSGRRALVAMALAGPAGMFAASASATPPGGHVDQACTALASAVHKVIRHAGTAQVQTISTQFRAPGPGTLTGEIAFNATGRTITVAADASESSSSGGCGVGAAGPGIPKGRGRTRIVSTLTRTFTSAGRYTITFTLNRMGEKMLARLGGEERAYRTRHPHGAMPPAIAFGVSISYEPAG
jgi:hypothetical protein